MVDDLVDKSVLQQQTRLLARDAALLHVEHSGVVELAYGRAMGTFHVVGIDFKHRLGIHTRLAGGRQVLVGHLRGGLLCPLLYQHAAGKGAGGLVVEHILIEFVAGAVGRLMDNQRVVVNMLLLVGNDASVTFTLGTLARERQVKLVAGDAVVQGYHVVGDTARALLVDIDIAHAYILMMGLLQAVEVEVSTSAHKGLDDLCGQEVAVVGGMVAEEQLHLSTLLHHDEHAAVDHQVDIAAQNIDDLHSTADINMTGNIHQQPVLRQHGVQITDGGLVLACQPVVIAARHIGMLGQRADDNTFWQLAAANGQALTFHSTRGSFKETVVDHKI